jgi:hypothetical protein
MKKILTFFFALCWEVARSVGGGVSSEVFVPHHPTCFELATTANRFIALGEEGTVAELTRRWNEVRNDSRVESSTREQIGWVCRLVFTAKPGATLRPPMFGGHDLPFDSFQGSDWPFFPLAESDGVFFLLAEGYVLSGLPEDPLDYLSYCRANGLFRHDKMAIPSEEKAAQALDRFLRSEEWKRIKWQNSGSGFHYDMSATPIIEFLRAQTKKRAGQPR